MPATSEGAAAGPARRVTHVFRAAEEYLASAALAAMVLLPLAEIALRPLVTGGIPGAIPFVQHLTLWVGFVGAMIAAREGRLIALATATFLPEGRIRRAAQLFAATIGALVCAALAHGSIEVIRVERELATEIARGLPAWILQLVLPLAFAGIAVRLIWRAGPIAARVWAASGAVAGLLLGAILQRLSNAIDPSASGPWLSTIYQLLDGAPAWPWVVLVTVAALAGAPVFTVLGGAALLLYMPLLIPPVQVVLDAYDRLVDPTLPAVPLFTLTGFILAQGRAPDRLLAVFRALVGWVHGGTAVVCVLVCAFFTVFTGASGVTILAMGGILLPALISDGYRDRFAVGLLTASGSIGLLLPPALPLILYAVVAEVSPRDLFIGGILPGLVLIGLLAVWSVREGLGAQVSRKRFDGKAVWPVLWTAKWELLLPLVVLGAYLGGVATLVETAALSTLYAAVVTGLIHRDFGESRSLRRATRDCVVLVGGVLIIIAVAQGFTQYLFEADVPFRLLAWTQGQIESPLVFLMALNVALLLVGCLMDIFSAIAVVVPLITTIGVAYGIDPVHLGIIFVANLELGYMTPPIGLNLFFASYRFERPLLEVYRAALPLLLLLAVGVLLITYVPWLSLGPLNWLGRS